MSTRIANIASILFIAAAGLVAVYLYPSLPEQIPTHWNLRGEVDGYTAKPWGVVLLPLMAVFVYVLMKMIPIISPKGYRTESFTGVVNIFQVTVVGFMSVIAILVFLAAGGLVDVHLNEAVRAGVGLLLIILGNYFGKVRKNFFLGIRTPWTLASDEVWSRTHRLGGWVFTVGGLAIIVATFLDLPPLWAAYAVFAMAILLVLYSYLLYRRIEGFEPDEGGQENEAGKPEN